MAATVTKVGGQGIIGGVGAVQQYTVALDTSFAAGGEPIDLTADFKQITHMSVGSNDANADNAYAFAGVHPGSGTDITSSNVLISAYQSNNTAEALDEANAVDLSSVGELNVLVIGKPAITTSWA